MFSFIYKDNNFHNTIWACKKVWMKLVLLINDMTLFFVPYQRTFIKSIIPIFALYSFSFFRTYSVFLCFLLREPKKSYLIKTFYCLMWDGSSNFITWILMDNGTYRLNHDYVMEWKKVKTVTVKWWETVDN